MTTNPQDAAEGSEMVLVSRSISAPKRLPLAAIVLCSISAVTLFNGSGASAVTKQPTAWQQPDSLNPASFTPAADYSKFSHKYPSAHEDFAKPEKCRSCHRRRDNSLAPRFPVHKDCTGCHLVQFTATISSSPINPICTICHKEDGLNSSNPPTKSFPALLSFTAEFDHAQHMRGIESARPPDGCAACHAQARRGVAMTIPAGPNAHGSCYSCHSPEQKASNSSSCGSCHKYKPGRYSPTSTAARSYRFGFSHAAHTARERLTCDRCHNLQGRGLPQTRQVTSILPAQHYINPRAQSCATCHNGRQRTFGDKSPNFDVCKRCHKGLKFGA